LLENGTGYTIAKFGTNEHDVYRQFFRNGVFKSEEKIGGVTYGEFKPDEE